MNTRAQFIESDKYHAMDGWSSTQVKKVVTHSIERALIPIEDTPALTFGRTMHDYFESPTDFMSKYAVFDDTDVIQDILTRRPDITSPTMTKDYKKAKSQFEQDNEDKTVIGLQEYDTLQKMYNSVIDSPFYMNRVQSSMNEGADVIREGSFFCDYETQYGPIKLKARPDLLILGSNGNLIVDWKSCADASRNAFRRDFFKYSYDVQAVFYARVLGLSPYAFHFVAIEKTEPYSCATYSLSEETATVAMMNVDEALERIGRYVHTGEGVKIPVPEEGALCL